MAFLEGAGNVPQQAFQQWNDPHGNKLIALNRDGTIDCLGLQGGAAVSVNDPVAVAAGKSGAIQTVRVACTLTVEDIQLGYKEISFDWLYPWPDLNETTGYCVCNPDQTDGTDFAPGCVFSRTENGMSAILNLTAASPIVQGQYDNFDTSAPLTYSFTPLVTGMYEISQYLHPKGSAGSNADGIESVATYTGEGTDGVLTLEPPYTPMSTTRNGGVADDASPIYAQAGSPITLTTEFTTYAIVGIAAGSFYGHRDGVSVLQTGTGSTGLELNNPGITTISAVQVTSATSATLTVADSTGGGPGFPIGAPVVIAGLVGSGAAQVNGTASTVVAAPALIGGTVSSGTFVVGESVVQLTSGSSGNFYQVAGGSLYLNNFVDLDATDHTHTWVGLTSGAVFTPTNSSAGDPMAGTVIIVAGSGWTTHANVTGLSGSINSYLYIAQPTLSPNNSEVWTDTVNGGTMTPSTLPTIDTFPYHYSVRVVQMPSNQTIYTPGMTTYLNFISIHD